MSVWVFLKCFFRQNLLQDRISLRPKLILMENWICIALVTWVVVHRMK